jgi:hypothetical protein
VKFRKLIPTRSWLKKYSELVDRESAYELLIKKNYTSRKRSCNKEVESEREKATTKATKTAETRTKYW